jgi:hypothetical protein
MIQHPGIGSEYFETKNLKAFIEKMFSDPFNILQYQAIYRIVQESASYVFYSTVILLLAAIVSVSQMSGSDSKIPLYKDESLGSESAKKKWTFDAITILRKGNMKVC